MDWNGSLTYIGKPKKLRIKVHHAIRPLKQTESHEYQEIKDPSQSTRSGRERERVKCTPGLGHGSGVGIPEHSNWSEHFAFHSYQYQAKQLATHRVRVLAGIIFVLHRRRVVASYLRLLHQRIPFRLTKFAWRSISSTWRSRRILATFLRTLLRWYMSTMSLPFSNFPQRSKSSS